MSHITASSWGAAIRPGASSTAATWASHGTVHSPPRVPAPSESYVTTADTHHHHHPPEAPLSPNRIVKIVSSVYTPAPGRATNARPTATHISVSHPQHTLSPLQCRGVEYSPSVGRGVPAVSPAVRRSLDLSHEGDVVEGQPPAAPTPLKVRVFRDTVQRPPETVPCRPHASQGFAVMSPTHCELSARREGAVSRRREQIAQQRPQNNLNLDSQAPTPTWDAPIRLEVRSGTQTRTPRTITPLDLEVDLSIIPESTQSAPVFTEDSQPPPTQSVASETREANSNVAQTERASEDGSALLQRVLRLEEAVQGMRGGVAERVQELAEGAEVRDLRISIQDEEIRRLKEAAVADEVAVTQAALLSAEEAQLGVSQSVRHTEDRARRMAAEVEELLASDRRRTRYASPSLTSKVQPQASGADSAMLLPEALPGWSYSSFALPDEENTLHAAVASQRTSDSGVGLSQHPQRREASPLPSPSPSPPLEGAAPCARPPPRLAPASSSSACSDNAEHTATGGRRSPLPTKSPALIAAPAVLPLHGQSHAGPGVGGAGGGGGGRVHTVQTVHMPTATRQHRSFSASTRSDVSASSGMSQGSVFKMHDPYPSHPRTVSEEPLAAAAAALSLGVEGGGSGYQPSQTSSPRVYRSLTASSDASSIRAIASSRQQNYQNACLALASGDTEAARGLLMKCASDGQAMTEALRSESASGSR